MSRLDLTENAHDLANTRPTAIAAIVELHLEHNAIPGLLRIARAADAFLSVPRHVERDPDGIYRADFTPQQEARQVLAKALADFEAGQ